MDYFSRGGGGWVHKRAFTWPSREYTACSRRQGLSVDPDLAGSSYFTRAVNGLSEEAPAFGCCPVRKLRQIGVEYVPALLVHSCSSLARPSAAENDETQVRGRGS